MENEREMIKFGYIKLYGCFEIMDEEGGEKEKKKLNCELIPFTIHLRNEESVYRDYTFFFFFFLRFSPV